MKDSEGGRQLGRSLLGRGADRNKYCQRNKAWNILPKVGFLAQVLVYV